MKEIIENLTYMIRSEVVIFLQIRMLQNDSSQMCRTKYFSWIIGGCRGQDDQTDGLIRGNLEDTHFRERVTHKIKWDSTLCKLYMIPVSNSRISTSLMNGFALRSYLMDLVLEVSLQLK
jgi:hypothetical protein